MSRKPQLKINTQFYGEQQSSQQRQFEDLLGIPPFSQQKRASAAMFERLISSNLAQKFISCWKSLKNLLQIRNRQNVNFNPYQNFEERIDHNNMPSLRKYAHTNSHQKNLHPSSSKHRYHNSRQYQRQQEQVIYRTKSVDLKLQLSRAQILNKIAEKLKENRSYTPKGQDNNIQIIKRLNKLERTLKEIRAANQATHEKAITSRMQFQKYQKNQLQTLKVFQEINQLKHQLRNMKEQNFQIIKNQNQRLRQSKLRQSAFKQQLNHYPPFYNYSRNPSENYLFSNLNKPIIQKDIQINLKEAVPITNQHQFHQEPIIRQKNLYSTNNNYIQVQKQNISTNKITNLHNPIIQSKPSNFTQPYFPLSLEHHHHQRYNNQLNPFLGNIANTNIVHRQVTYSNNKNHIPINQTTNNPINIGIKKVGSVYCSVCGRNCGCQAIYNRL